MSPFSWQCQNLCLLILAFITDWRVVNTTSKLDKKFTFIRYMFGNIDQNALVAYYRDADVALVTPLRDGMNLVCKEFVVRSI